MKLKLAALLILTLLVFGCKKKSKKAVIPKDDFIPILVDMHLMDGMISKGEIREDIIKSDTIDYYKALLRQHGYTKTQFDSSVVYYSRDLKKFERIYQQVIARLNRMETQAHEEIKEARQEEAGEQGKEGAKKEEKEKKKEDLLQRR